VKVWCTEKMWAMCCSDMPMPVSRTVSSSGESASHVSVTEMAPHSGVNLMALERRPNSICLNLWQKERRGHVVRTSSSYTDRNWHFSH
jgi:hypothetical protein